MNAVAAGWGRFAPYYKSTRESSVLRAVELKVANKRYKHYSMIGTLIQDDDGVYRDPCSGDSGVYS